ncbi:hypothetical protein [Nostoc sp. NMS4]|uniref:hypothetical protein n=1 Tax=Nostoc sp. NMS4 TaxID=2815390 RepID=UPI0025E4AF87|nr:hypothetical protein [Nostoc sp. NMS4]MBN3922971.1 hypothetical protein [Nostoc sp. NMS4]
MYRFWRLDIKANSVHSSKFSNPRTSSFNKSLTAWVQMAIAYGTLRERTNLTGLPAAFSVSRNSLNSFSTSFLRRDL